MHRESRFWQLCDVYIAALLESCCIGWSAFSNQLQLEREGIRRADSALIGCNLPASNDVHVSQPAKVCAPADVSAVLIRNADGRV